eukprot:1440922-Pleurochrysis_carterae.AAC.1
MILSGLLHLGLLRRHGACEAAAATAQEPQHHVGSQQFTVCPSSHGSVFQTQKLPASIEA